MFTGIIETVGKVLCIKEGVGGLQFLIEAPEIETGVKIGDSISVDGACLTVTSVGSGEFSFDVIPETLSRTSLVDLKEMSLVNLERALPAGGRFDGHFVQGHVDAVGVVSKREKDGDDVRLYIDCNRAFCDYLVEKGSVAISGVSLTVVGVEGEQFDVALIPHTLAITTLRSLEIGSLVNLEADILGKYVKRYLSKVS